MDLRSGSGPNLILLPLICWRYPGATPGVMGLLAIGLKFSRHGSNHFVRRQRPPDPLQLELAHGLDLHCILDFRRRSRADEDLPRLGFIAEARGYIGHRPDSGIVEPALEADGAQRGKAVRDADAEANLVPEAGPGLPSGLRGRHVVQAP